MKIVLVCGDRDWKDGHSIYRHIQKENDKGRITFLIEGGARGADKLAKEAALRLGIQPVECEALWDYLGKRAGPVRNQQQLNLAIKLTSSSSRGHGDPIETHKLIVLAFHSDLENSKGTKDMVERARKAGVKVKVIK